MSKRVLINQVSDAPTQRALRALQDRLDETSDALSELDSTTGALTTGVSSVTSATGVLTASPTTGDVVLTLDLTGYSPVSHTHPESDITGLITDLAGKAPLSHTHPESDITGLIADLAAKVPVTRTISTTAPLSGGGALSSDLTLSVLADGITDALLRNSAALSVIGRSANSIGDPADIVASSDGDVLRRSGTTLGFGTIPATSVTGLITSIVAGTNLSGGGSSGAVTVNVIANPTFSGLVTMSAGFTLGADSSANSHKITSLTNGSSAQDAAAFGQIGTAIAAAVSGTTNTLAKFTSTSVIGNSRITDDATNVRILTGDIGVNPYPSTGSWATAPGWTIFGPNGNTPTGANLGLGWSTTFDGAAISVIAPGVNWKPLYVTASTVTIRPLGDTANDVLISSAGLVVKKDLAVLGNSALGDGSDIVAVYGSINQVSPATGPTNYTLKPSGAGSLGLMCYAQNDSVVLFDTEYGGGSVGWIARDTSIAAVHKYNGQLWMVGGAGLTLNAANEPAHLTALTNPMAYWQLSTGDLFQNHALTVKGNATLGDATSDVHTVNGATTINGPAGAYALTVVPGTGGGVRINSAPVAYASGDIYGSYATMAGTFNTTAGAVFSVGYLSSVTSTRSSGANSLFNAAFYAISSGGQGNYNFYGASASTVYNAGDLQIGGSSTLGDSPTADTHAVNGPWTLSGPLNATVGLVLIGEGGTQTGSSKTFSVSSTPTAANQLGLVTRYGVYSAATITRPSTETNGRVLGYAGYFNADLSPVVGGSFGGNHGAYGIYATATPSSGHDAWSGYFDAGAFYVGGAATFASTLGVTGTTTLAAVSATTLSVSGAATLPSISGPTTITGNLAVTGSTTLGDSTSADATVIYGFLTQLGPATPGNSNYVLRSNGLGGLSFLNYSADNVMVGFDTDFNGSWIARSTSVAALYKSGGHFFLYGSGGNSVGGAATLTTWLDVNLTTGATVIAGALSVVGAFNCDGNTILGNTTSDAHTVYGRTDMIAPVNGLGLAVSDNNTTQTGHDLSVIQGSIGGTYNTTGGLIWRYALRGYAVGTRSSGANVYANFGIRTDASGGQEDYGGYFNASGTGQNIGVYANASGGSSNYSFYGIAGTLYNAGNLQIDGNTTLGNSASGDTVTITAKTTASAFIRATVASGSDGLIVGTSSKQWDWYPNGTTLSLWEFTTTLEAGGGADRFTIAAGGNATFTANLAVNGSATLGDASGDAHTVNGNVTFSNTPTAGPIKYGSLNGRIYLGRQVLTSSSGTYTPSTGAKAVLLRMVGGGGGSAGSAGGASALSTGGGGGSGAYIEKWIDAAANITGGAYHAGPGGAAGSSGANAGGTGTDSDVIIQGVTYTAKSGTGGLAMASGTSALTVLGGVPQSGSTSADFESGTAAGPGVRISNIAAFSGAGGSNPLGVGGIQTNAANQAGIAGRGYGAGAGGSLASTTNQAGAAGKAGVIIIDEYA